MRRTSHQCELLARSDHDALVYIPSLVPSHEVLTMLPIAVLLFASWFHHTKPAPPVAPADQVDPLDSGDPDHPCVVYKEWPGVFTFEGDDDTTGFGVTCTSAKENWKEQMTPKWSARNLV